MTLVETLIVLLMATQPFGGIPFTVSAVGTDKIQVELMQEPPVQMVFNDQLEIIEVNHKERRCEKDI